MKQLTINNLDWQEITSVMDTEIRESLHTLLCPCDEVSFLRAYVERDPSMLDFLRSEFKEIANSLNN